VGPVDIFRAIREQGRDRVADLFAWKQGKVTFYRGQVAPHVEFPLDLELPALMLAGLEVERPADSPLDTYRIYLDTPLVAAPDEKARFRGVAWPPLAARVLSIAVTPKPLRDILKLAARGGAASPGDVLRAIEVLLEARLIAWR
jgi:hypothetical protein